jgi:putative transposase
VRYRLIKEQHSWHRVTTLCRVMDVSRSGYYQWLKRSPSARARWLYVAVVIDLFSRRVIGWSMGANASEDLTLSALQMALESRSPKPGLLHHSDRGVHYASHRYQQRLREHGIRASMSRPANCTDNAVVESFFSSLKNELTLHERYPSRSKARADIFNYIEMFYNRQRQHSYLGYVSPAEFERGRVNKPRV